MPLFGNKLVALHVHDNHRLHNGDNHMIPFDACIDFDRVTTQIAKTKYTRSLMLEVMASHHPFYAQTSAEDYYAKASAAAKKLADMIENKRA